MYLALPIEMDGARLDLDDVAVYHHLPAAFYHVDGLRMGLVKMGLHLDPGGEPSYEDARCFVLAHLDGLRLVARRQRICLEDVGVVDDGLTQGIGRAGKRNKGEEEKRQGSAEDRLSH